MASRVFSRAQHGVYIYLYFRNKLFIIIIIVLPYFRCRRHGPFDGATTFAEKPFKKTVGIMKRSNVSIITTLPYSRFNNNSFFSVCELGKIFKKNKYILIFSVGVWILRCPAPLYGRRCPRSVPAHEPINFRRSHASPLKNNYYYQYRLVTTNACRYTWVYVHFYTFTMIYASPSVKVSVTLLSTI